MENPLERRADRRLSRTATLRKAQPQPLAAGAAQGPARGSARVRRQRATFVRQRAGRPVLRDRRQHPTCLAFADAVHHRVIHIAFEPDAREFPGYPRIQRIVEEQVPQQARRRRQRNGQLVGWSPSVSGLGVLRTAGLAAAGGDACRMVTFSGPTSTSFDEQT